MKIDFTRNDDIIIRQASQQFDFLPWFNPLNILLNFWQNRSLIKRLAHVEIVARYKGSYLGMFWAFLIPLMMLGIYTFIFSFIFGAKWGIPQESKSDFAIILFAGLVTFNLFSEVVSVAPGLILSRPMFVKKIVFPLEILPLVALINATVNALLSTIILLCSMLLIRHSIPSTILYLPIVWLPLLLFTLGIAYFLSSIGVFIRDIGHFISITVMMFFFISPIFYSPKMLFEKLPEKFHIFFKLNPMSVFVGDTRNVLIYGNPPDWPWTLLMLAVSLIVFISGFVWFMKSKPAFADVI